MKRPVRKALSGALAVMTITGCIFSVGCTDQSIALAGAHEPGSDSSSVHQPLPSQEQSREKYFTTDEPQLRVLTRLETEATLQWVLGPISFPATAPELRRAGFARVGARHGVVSSSAIETHASAVEQVLQQVFADEVRLELLIGCEPTESACALDFIQRSGQRAWRRPLSTAEIARYHGLFDLCTDDANGDVMAGYRCVLSGLLQSPWFMYRVELPHSDGVFRGYAMASRLSYFLWGAPPDVVLLDKAYAGDLDTAQGVRATAQAMLDDPRSRAGLRSFVSEWFRLDRLDRIRRDVLAETSSEVQFILGKNATLQPWLQWWVHAAKEELQKMVEHQVFDVDGDYLDLLTTDTTFVDQKLFDMYRNTAQAGEYPSSFGVAPTGDAIQMTGQLDAQGFASAVHSPNSPRRGLLGTMAVLSQLGKQNETSPTRRGLYVMRRILCLEVGEPPENIDQCKRPEGTSRRESMEVHHMCTPTCSGCHKQMDPIGFALDSFDTVGRHRGTDDWGFPLDTSVTWTLIDKGESTQVPFNGLRSMSEAFFALPQATDCVTTQVFRFATGREETAADDGALNDLTKAFVSDGRRLEGFLMHFVGTDAFRRAAPTTDASAPAPTLTQVVEKVFTPACGSCHVGTDLGGLSLIGDERLLQRLRAPALGMPSMPLITPGSPEASYLWHKVMNSHLDVGGVGSRMPPTEPLHTAELDLLRAWIVASESNQIGGAK